MYQKYPSFFAPQTEIPLTGEMSRSDKRVTARYEQLEPVTLNMLSATAVAPRFALQKADVSVVFLRKNAFTGILTYIIKNKFDISKRLM